MNLLRPFSGSHPAVDDEEPDMTDRRKPSGWDHPFWKVMGSVMGCLMLLIVWLAERSYEQLQQINGSQLQMQVQLSDLLRQQTATSTDLMAIHNHLESLDITSTVHQQDINAIKDRLRMR